MTQPGEPDPWATPAEPGSAPPPPPPPAPYAAPPPPPAGYPPPPPGYGQQPPYGYPPGYGYPQQSTVNGLAIASLVLGILWIYWIGSVLALVFGYVARNQIRARNQRGDGLAIAGIVLGWVGVGFLLLFIVLGAAAGSGAFG